MTLIGVERTVMLVQQTVLDGKLDETLGICVKLVDGRPLSPGKLRNFSQL